MQIYNKILIITLENIGIILEYLKKISQKPSKEQIWPLPQKYAYRPKTSGSFFGGNSPLSYKIIKKVLDVVLREW